MLSTKLTRHPSAINYKSLFCVALLVISLISVWVSNAPPLKPKVTTTSSLIATGLCLWTSKEWSRLSTLQLISEHVTAKTHLNFFTLRSRSKICCQLLSRANQIVSISIDFHLPTEQFFVVVFFCCVVEVEHIDMKIGCLFKAANTCTACYYFAHKV